MTYLCCPEREKIPKYSGLKGAVAQSVEQRTENPCVAGSIPARTTERVRKCSLFFASKRKKNDAVVRRGGQRTENPCVAGSIPATAQREYERSLFFYFPLFPDAAVIEGKSRSKRYIPALSSPMSFNLSRILRAIASSSICSATYHCRKLCVV